MWYSACWVLLRLKQSITKNNISKISSEWSRTPHSCFWPSAVNPAAALSTPLCLGSVPGVLQRAHSGSVVRLRGSVLGFVLPLYCNCLWPSYKEQSSSWPPVAPVTPFFTGRSSIIHSFPAGHLLLSPLWDAMLQRVYIVTLILSFQTLNIALTTLSFLVYMFYASWWAHSWCLKHVPGFI